MAQIQMHTRNFLSPSVNVALCLLTLIASPAFAAEPAWPQFRGPDGLAISEGSPPPVHFGPGTNLLWKIALPTGHSSPCIWGGRIFLTAVNDGKLETLCLDRAGGRILWQRPVQTANLERTHRLGSPAASTPATDGRRVYVYFGSFGLVAYTLEGAEEWTLPLPSPMVEFGAATSPILAGDKLIVVQDQDQGSYLLAVDTATGKTVWRTERPEFRRSFASPFIWKHDGEEELIVPGSIWLRSYDLKDGKESWSFSGTSRVANSTPAAGAGLLYSASWNVGADPSDRINMEPWEVFAAEHDENKDGKLAASEIPAGAVRDRFSQMDLNKDGFTTAAEWQQMADMFAKAGNALLAIRPGGEGDITKTHLAWKSTRSLPYVCSPLYYDGRVYTVKNGGLASCYEASTGKVFYQDERLDAGGDYYASLVAAGGRIIAASQKGQVVIWEAGDTLKILARNDLGEEIMATPAVVEGILYVRTTDHLFAFGQNPAPGF